jgi:hypothetical protein
MTIPRDHSCAGPDRSRGRPRRFSRIATLGALSLLLFSSLALGCMDIRMRIGERPNTDLLETALRLGESTPPDVLRVLGTPFGKGQALLPIDPRPRAMWSYYYEEGDLKDSRRIFLFVYFDQDRYDGYMWFSSLLK